MHYQQRANLILDLIQCQENIEILMGTNKTSQDTGDIVGSNNNRHLFLKTLNLLHHIEGVVDARPQKALATNVIPFQQKRCPI